MFKMFASESKETVFPYYHFSEMIISRGCESFFNFSPFIG